IAQCRDLENHHHKKLLEISISTLEKIVKGDLDEDLPDDLRAGRFQKFNYVEASGTF
ncbi:DRC3 isoform 9, partial [Pongo abelii]